MGNCEVILKALEPHSNLLLWTLSFLLNIHDTSFCLLVIFSFAIIISTAFLPYRPGTMALQYFSFFSALTYLFMDV